MTLTEFTKKVSTSHNDSLDKDDDEREDEDRDTGFFLSLSLLHLLSLNWTVHLPLDPPVTHSFASSYPAAPFFSFTCIFCSCPGSGGTTLPSLRDKLDPQGQERKRGTRRKFRKETKA